MQLLKHCFSASEPILSANPYLDKHQGVSLCVLNKLIVSLLLRITKPKFMSSSLSEKQLLEILSLGKEAYAIYTTDDIIIESANEVMLGFSGKG